MRPEIARWGLTILGRCLTVFNYDFAVAPSPSPSSSGGRGVGEASNLIDQAIIRLSPLTRFTPAGFLLLRVRILGDGLICHRGTRSCFTESLVTESLSPSSEFSGTTQ